MNASYHAHVVMGSAAEASPIIDKALGSLLAVCFLFGTAGNVVSLSYFMSTKRSTLTEQLYTAICSIDACTCVFQFPVMVSLLTNRKPGLFDNLAFCGVWSVVFEFLQVTSIFLVMLISLTRMISITFPFIKLYKRLVIFSFVAYCVISCIPLVMGIHVQFTFYYIGDLSYCVKGTRVSWFNNLHNFFSSMQMGIPPLIIFISFVVSTLQLRRSMNAAAQERNRKASTTITIFTFIFLVCNFPCFVLLVLFTIQKVLKQAYPGYFFSINMFMSLHSWSVAKVGFVVLNASVNPIMYVFRMQRLRMWVRNLKNININIRSRASQLSLRSIGA